MGCRLERIRTRRTGVRMSPTGRRRPKPQAIRGLEASFPRIRRSPLTANLPVGAKSWPPKTCVDLKRQSDRARIGGNRSPRDCRESK
jgi:hypothetical protein